MADKKQYLEIPNWNKYQPRLKNGHPNRQWIRLQCNLEDNPDYCHLSDFTKLIWVGLLRLAGRTGHWCPANDPHYVRNALALEPRSTCHVSASVSHLLRIGFLTLTNQQNIIEFAPRDETRRDVLPKGSTTGQAAPSSRNGHAKTNGAASDSTALFDRLWRLYPEKGKRAGVDWTAQIFLGLEIHDKPDDILAGLALWIESTDWQRDGGKFVPSLENFLRKQLWRIKPKNESLNPYMEEYPVDQALKDLEDYDAKRQGRVRKTG